MVFLCLVLDRRHLIVTWDKTPSGVFLPSSSLRKVKTPNVAVSVSNKIMVILAFDGGSSMASQLTGQTLFCPSRHSGQSSKSVGKIKRKRKNTLPTSQFLKFKPCFWGELAESERRIKKLRYKIYSKSKYK